MKKTPFKRHKKTLKRTRIRVKGHPETKDLKKEVQSLVRAIAIARDGGCVLRHFSEAGKCGGVRSDGELILQAEHLLTRSNSGTFGDMRNIVCLCLRHHSFFKTQHGKIYWELIRKHIGEKRWSWLKRAEQDRTPHKVDWKLAIIDLKNQLKFSPYKSLQM